MIINILCHIVELFRLHFSLLYYRYIIAISLGVSFSYAISLLLDTLSIKVLLIHKLLRLSIQFCQLFLQVFNIKIFYNSSKCIYYLRLCLFISSEPTSWAAMSASKRWCFLSKFWTAARSLPQSSEASCASSPPSQKSMSFTASLYCCCWLASRSFCPFSAIFSFRSAHCSSRVSIWLETSASQPTHSLLSMSAE